MSTRKRAVLTRTAIGDSKLRNSRTLVSRTIVSRQSELPPMPAGGDDRAANAAGAAELAARVPFNPIRIADTTNNRHTGETLMPEAGTLLDAFIDELRDTYDAERQLTRALPRLARAACSPELRDAFEAHLEETRTQVERLEAIFGMLDEKVRGKHCEGIAGIIEEGRAIIGEEFDEPTMDACLIAAGQRAEHYEMAAYGTLVAWANAMGHLDAAGLLQATLDEEKAADEKLSALAEKRINEQAAEAAARAQDAATANARRR
jgi:ferritin-like metal-binding protein YciE